MIFVALSGKRRTEEFEPVLCVGAGRLVTASISDSCGFGITERGPIKDSSWILYSKFNGNSFSVFKI